MIEVKDLTFSYGRTPVLFGLSFTLAPGELFSVIGANGCGKTTLLSVLARMLPDFGGSITVDGRDIVSYSSREYARKVSLLSQERQTPEMTVADYVAAGRYPYVGFSGRMSSDDEEAVDRAVRATNIGSFLSKRLGELSGGERQRVYFALLMAQDTTYVLLDEPSSHLDVPSAIAVNETVTAMRQSGKGIISVSHDLSSALKYSDRILLLRDGRAAFLGSPADAVTSGEIEKAFGVRCYPVTVDGEPEYLFKKGNDIL